jgi:hypothetical protein
MTVGISKQLNLVSLFYVSLHPSKATVLLYIVAINWVI